MKVAGTEKFLSVCALGVVPVILEGSEGSKLPGVLTAPGYISFFTSSLENLFKWNRNFWW